MPCLEDMFLANLTCKRPFLFLLAILLEEEKEALVHLSSLQIISTHKEQEHPLLQFKATAMLPNTSSGVVFPDGNMFFYFGHNSCNRILFSSHRNSSSHWSVIWDVCQCGGNNVSDAVNPIQLW
ncbi:hypothetical protein TNCV_3912791 [Trichonephila clavipes]|nr:hypothetical protein TNCV_3912791 [Trichonephila clavipes]